MPKKRLVSPDGIVAVSLGVQLLDFAEAEALASQTWAGAEEILENIDLSRHPSSRVALSYLLDHGWESDSVTGLLLGLWMKKIASAKEIAGDLLSLGHEHRRVLTALYESGDDRTVIQYSVTPEGRLMQHSYSRKAMGAADIPLFAT